MTPLTSSVPQVAEETTVYFATQGEARSVQLNGQGLVQYQDRLRTPYLEEVTSSGVRIRLTDWVGRLEFLIEDAAGVHLHPLLVYPAKLSADPAEAFRALATISDEVAAVSNSPLGFPAEMLPPAGASRRIPLSLRAVQGYAAQAWRLWQQARQLPRARALRQIYRTDRSGSVPDRVDWEATLRHWAGGGFPAHLARDLPPLQPPTGVGAIAVLWDALIAAAQLTGDPGGAQAVQRYRAAQAELPAVCGVPGSDPVSCQALRLAREVTILSEQARGLPSGHTRMAELYELWAMLTLARAAGASEGEFGKDAEGLYSGRLTGEGVEVQLNLKLAFSGAGPVRQFARPDILMLWGDEALVADVKYRPLHRLTTEQLRAVNDQLLRYMGLTYARTGLAVWPAPLHESLHRGELPGSRARLGRIRLHPLDPPQMLVGRLTQFGVPATTFRGDP
ncbi:MAG: hypothetical protein Q4C67_06545 [Deinococcus sp.]|nr:hypothetical protein [Deinococcus sp.]